MVQDLQSHYQLEITNLEQTRACSRQAHKQVAGALVEANVMNFVLGTQVRQLEMENNSIKKELTVAFILLGRAKERFVMFCNVWCDVQRWFDQPLNF